MVEATPPELLPACAQPADARFPWLWLGTWSLGGEGFGSQDLRESQAVIQRAFACGVRHFDTAPLYAHGRAEELVGRSLKPVRGQVFISTKAGLSWNGRSVHHCGQPYALRRSLHESLTRLRTDYVDLLQLHWPDPDVPLDESLGELMQLRESGLVRHVGVGNLSAQQVSTYLREGGLTPHQVHFNPLWRAHDVLAAGAVENRCIHCITSPLEQGLLGTNPRSQSLTDLGKRDVRRRNPLFKNEAARTWADAFRALCARRCLPVVTVVLLWILSQPHVHVVVAGPRRFHQLDEVLDHAQWLESLGLRFPCTENHAAWLSTLREAMGEALFAHLREPPPEGRALPRTRSTFS